MSKAIRIDDLHTPRLDEVQREALDQGEGLVVDLSVDGILERARAQAGLDDFGPDDFRQRLELLVDEWGSDPDIYGLHRQVLHDYLVRYASNRLLIQDQWRRHPEILNEEIRRPIIVAGLPRSGTTHLVNLLAADERLHSLPLWEACEPVPRPGEVATGDAGDPRHQRCAEAWEGMQATMPLLAAMHPMDPDHIHEELELMGPDFASYNFEWLSPSPRWRDHYLATDQTPHYEYLRDVLKLLQWRRGPGRWVLKCPQHLEQLSVLRKVFPDATVAITHRDPVAVIQSAVTMLAYGDRMRRRRIDAQRLIDYWTDRVEQLLRACVRDRSVWPEEQSIDVLFHEFMGDDLAMVERIHQRAGLATTAEAREQLARYMAANPRGSQGRMVYDLKGDFGVDPAELRERFAFYFEQFPVRPEVQ